jgi:soluble lytic murein transglycosylase
VSRSTAPGLPREVSIFGRVLVLLAVLVTAGVVAQALFPTEVRAAVRAVVDRRNLVRVEGWRDELQAASIESGLDVNLLAGVALAESSGRVDARSRADAMGLFQLRMVTAQECARDLGLPNPTEEQLLSDGALSARLGARYLARWTDRYDGNVERALVAYNLGPTRAHRDVKRAGGWEAWKEAHAEHESLRYAQRVLHLSELFRSRGRLELDPLPPGAAPPQGG